MRLMKIPLFLLMVLVLWASGAHAQATGCAGITPSPNDFVQVKAFLGKPGDTAQLGRHAGGVNDRATSPGYDR